MNRCDESCITVKNPFGRICAPNNVEDSNLKAVSMIKEIMNQEHPQNISHVNLRCEFDSRECNLKQK